MRKIYTFCLLLFCGVALAQPVQTIRGKVVEKESRYPLIGVTVKILGDSGKFTGTVTDENGFYSLQKVKVGRHILEFSYIGYDPVRLNNVEVSSAKEVILDIEMEEKAISGKEVVITDKKNNGDPGNEMATVSARSFTVEETDRFAGSRGDPSRMASNFAGVQGADDSRNDIVIRGNSPAGVLWRLEGIDIPNPNHFAIPGTSGGPVNIINNKILANSDFYTGAFPAEFGNATAGVFDLKLRPGNNQKFEHSFQFGFMGTELSSEGPISKEKKSSYLVGYRYSTLALFDKINFDIGTDAVPQYQDLSFKLNFPLKNNAVFSVWGIGGYSSIDILISNQEPEERNIYGQSDRDQYFTSRLGVAGASYKKSFNAKTFLNISAAASNQMVYAKHDYLFYDSAHENLLAKDPLLQYTFTTNTYSIHTFVNHKINNRITIKAGVMNDVQEHKFHDSARIVSGDTLGQWTVRWNNDNVANFFRPYIQAKFRLNTRASFNAGWYAQYYSLSDSWSAIEPRLGFKYALTGKSSFSFGAGIHSMMQSPYIYYYIEPGNAGPHNRGLDFTKSLHLVAGYDRFLGKNTRFKTEIYYQYLYNIPVEAKSSSFSLVNTGSGFTRFFPDTLENEGIGRNYGLEFTLERFFAKGYYYMLTASFFDARYQGSDGIWRNTDFNGKYAFNLLFTKEFKMKKNRSFQAGTKLTTTGGRYYSPADTVASNLKSELVELQSEKNTLQTTPYFRLDVRVSYKVNRTKVTHEIALDLINVLNTKNVLSLAYAPDGQGNNIQFNYQLGFLPMFYYRLNF